MKITLSIPQESGGPPTVKPLGDDGAGYYISGYSPAAVAMAQSVAPFRAPKRSMIPRGNVATTISFSVTREHESDAEAGQHASAQAKLVNSQGTLSIAYGSGTGAGTDMLEDAMLVSVSPTLIGHTTITAYRFESGAFS